LLGLALNWQWFAGGAGLPQAKANFEDAGPERGATP